MAGAGAEGGLLLLDKGAGWSSTRALGRAKRLLGQRKGGHTGTLDPFATGLLPLVFGEATKFSRFLLDAPKAYVATLCLGRTSTTCDPEGEISEAADFNLADHTIDDVLRGFVGVQQQIPPMHSAVHHQGKRLYELAREGVLVDREPRSIHIHSIERVSISAEKLVIAVKCSKGTYVRTLAQDIGERLGCGAYLTALRRTEVAGFEVEQAVTLEQLEAAGVDAPAVLLPPAALVEALPRFVLDAPGAEAIRRGQRVAVQGLRAGETALFGPGQRFLGVGLADGAGGLAALRLVATPDPGQLP
jgi:tRNA pseudouridine55 synthase